MFSKTINKLLFDYDNLSGEEVYSLASKIPNKLLRWLGANHPDNRTRKVFLELTNISIGKDTVINQNFIVSDDYKKLLKIGSRVAISPNVTIICSSSPNNSNLNRNLYVNKKLIKSEKVIIEDDVWIGANTVIMPGVKIGKNTIIGAGSIVVKSLDADSVYAGTPAKLLRKLN